MFKHISKKINSESKQLTSELSWFKDQKKVSTSQLLGKIVIILLLSYLLLPTQVHSQENSNITYGSPVQLNSPIVTSGDVGTFQISSNSEWVVFTADQNIDGVSELWSVSTTGDSLPVRLNPNLTPGGNVLFSFKISSDSKRVVYVADQDTNDVVELYSVPISGGPLTKLNANLVAGGDVTFFSPDFQISPDSQRVIYEADQDTNDVNELYSVSIDGGTPVKLNGNLVTGGEVSSFKISPNSQRVIYHADQDTNGRFEYYSVPIAGGVVVKLNPDFTANNIVSLNFQISPDSQRLVYSAGSQFGTFDLFSVPIAGGTVTKLNGNLIAGGGVGAFRFSPNSQWVVYEADQDIEDVEELYRVPLTGGTSTKLSTLSTDISFGENIFLDFEISPNGQRVVYRTGPIDVREIFSVPIAGDSSPIKLNANLVTGGTVFDFRMSPDSTQVVYRADQETDQFDELYSVSIDGGTPIKLNPSLVSSGGVALGYKISQNGQWVVYRARQDSDEVSELYSVPILGGGVTRVTSSLPVSSNTFFIDFMLSSDSQFIVYINDQNIFDQEELFSVQVILPESQETSFYTIPIGDGKFVTLPL